MAMESFSSEYKSALEAELHEAKERKAWGENTDSVHRFLETLIENNGNMEVCLVDGRVPCFDQEDHKSISSEQRKSGKNDHETDDAESPLSLEETARYIAECSRATKEVTRFDLQIQSIDVSFVSLFVSTKEVNLDDFLGNLPNFTTKVKLLLEVYENNKDDPHLIKSLIEPQHFTREFVRTIFGIGTENLEDLNEFLKSRLVAATCESQSEFNVVEPKLSYVSTIPEYTDVLFNSSMIQWDKSYAIVVTGECGSGKTTFSIKKSLQRGWMPLYVQLTKQIWKENPKPLLRKLQTLEGFLDRLIRGGTQQHLQSLYAIMKPISMSRSRWASEILDAAIKSVSEDENTRSPYRRWLQGQWKKAKRPSNVAVILDDAADIELVEGLLSITIEKMYSYRNLARNKVQLVIVGPGLDAIKKQHRIGTSPHTSRTIVVEGPAFGEMIADGVIDEGVAFALEHGLFAKVLKTNTRMFFRSVLPLQKFHCHSMDCAPPGYKKRRLDDPGSIDVLVRRRREERLKEVGSTKCIMDHGPRHFVNQNTVAEDMRDGTLQRLLVQSFCYHLAASIRGMNTSNFSEIMKKNAAVELNTIEGSSYHANITKETNNIFTRGIAWKGGTSKALQYLACFGLDCELRSTHLGEFGEITALHCMRYNKAFGYQPLRATLKHAWPPQDKTIEILGEILKKQEELELRSLKQQWTIPSSGRWCFVFSEEGDQEGNIFLLLLDADAKKASLESIQCKHYRKQPDIKVCHEWWSLLGVAFSHEGTSLEAESGTACYSLQGILGFKALLEKWMPSGFEIELGKRTLAVSFNGGADFPIPDNEHCRLWSREMFEPTFSVLDLNPFKAKDFDFQAMTEEDERKSHQFRSNAYL